MLKIVPATRKIGARIRNNTLMVFKENPFTMIPLINSNPFLDSVEIIQLIGSLINTANRIPN